MSKFDELKNIETEGKTLKEISEITGFPTTAIGHYLKSRDLPFKKGQKGKPKKVEFPEFNEINAFLESVEFTTIPILDEMFPELSYHKVNSYFKDHTKVLGKVAYKKHVLNKYLDMDKLSTESGYSKEEIIKHLKSVL